MENFLLPDNGHIEIKKDDVTGRVYVGVVIREQKKFDPKNGDFLFEDGRIMIAKSYPSNYHALIYPAMDDKVLYNKRYGLHFSTTSFRYATELEKQTLLDALEKEGKYWDSENKCIKDISAKDFEPKEGDYITIEYPKDSNFEDDCETNKVVGILRGKLSKGNKGFPFYAGINMAGELCLYGSFGNNEGDISRPSTEEERKELLEMLDDFAFWEKEEKQSVDDDTKNPQPKFKAGDKVRIKDGFSSKTHLFVEPFFTKGMNEFIGRKLTVNGYVPGYRYVNISESVYNFHEDWLELYKEEKQHKFKFKKGDKVKIKEGISNHTHYWEFPGFTKEKDAYIGKVLTVYGYDRFLQVEVDECDYTFSENWLEPCIEEIKQDDCQKLQSKFKIGDKVRIKDGISSKTHFSDGFIPQMDILLEKTLTIKEYLIDGVVTVKEDSSYFLFYEDWFEPVSESIKIGDWVIYFPDEDRSKATIGILSGLIIHDGLAEYIIDDTIHVYQVSKWDGTSEDLERIRGGKSWAQRR